MDNANASMENAVCIPMRQDKAVAIALVAIVLPEVAKEGAGQNWSIDIDNPCRHSMPGPRIRAVHPAPAVVQLHLVVDLLNREIESLLRSLTLKKARFRHLTLNRVTSLFGSMKSFAG